MPAKPLTHAQRGKLGGLTAAARMTAQQREDRALAGANAVLEKYGRSHFVRMALRKNGYKVEVKP